MKGKVPHDPERAYIHLVKVWDPAWAKPLFTLDPVDHLLDAQGRPNGDWIKPRPRPRGKPPPAPSRK